MLALLLGWGYLLSLVLALVAGLSRHGWVVEYLMDWLMTCPLLLMDKGGSLYLFKYLVAWLVDALDCLSIYELIPFCPFSCQQMTLSL
jgi:hypothetical protein